ncbi:MAG: OmpA family protein, partial [Bacteroidales bacterium]
PFMLEQQNQLYFGSEGHGNMGGFDMFVAVYDSTRGRWRKPLNLGYPYNTVGNDLAYIVSFQDLFIYCPQNSNKRREGISGSDCFSLKMPPREKLVTLKGQIHIPELNNEMPDDLQIAAVDNITGDTISVHDPEEDGSFVIEDLHAKEVTLVAMSSKKIQNQIIEVKVPSDYEKIEYPMEVYLNASELALKEMEEEELAAKEEVEAEEAETEEETEELAAKEEVETETMLEIKPVFFDFDKSYIKSPYRENLNNLASFMKEKSDFEIEIHGHTDHFGTESYNISLGHRRANAIRKFLTQHGVNENKIVTKSYGEYRPVAKPIADNEARKFNRRAEFKIIGDYDNVKLVSVHVPEKYRVYSSGHENHRTAGNTNQNSEQSTGHDDLQGAFLVIGGSFMYPENARKAVSQYENMGFSCRILPADNGFNRVVIESFESKQKATQKLSSLRQKTSVENLWILRQ